MYKKGSAANILVIIIIIAVIAIVGYLAFMRVENNSSNTNEPTTNTTDAPVNIDIEGPVIDGMKTFKGSFQTGFEGQNSLITYSLTYPVATYSSVKSNGGLITLNNSATGKADTIRLLNNSGAGFTNARGAYMGSNEAQAFCTGCKEISNKISILGVKDMITYASDTREVIVYPHAPGFVIAMFNEPVAPAEGVLAGLSIKSTAVANTMSVKVYYLNPKIKPTNNCNEVVTVNRTVPKTEQVANAALTALLQGPTAEEKTAGYQTQVPTGSALKSITIKNGVATADFNTAFGVGGGSCHVTALRAQVEATLKQFPTVKSVVIAINGNSTDVLQP